MSEKLSSIRTLTRLLTSAGILCIWFLTVVVAQNANSDLEPNLFRIKVDGKVGFIDRDGDIVIAPQFDDARRFCDGLAAVQIGKTWGFINENGSWRIPPSYDEAYGFSDGVAVVRERTQEKFSVVDKSGKTIIDDLDSTGGRVEEGLMAVKKGRFWGFIDTKGRFVIPPRFEFATYFVDGLANVQVADHGFYIDRKGRIKLDKDGSNFSEGLAEVSRPTGHYTNISGFIDTTGRLVIPYTFDEVGPFKNGLARIRLNFKWGYINRKGRIVVEPVYDKAEDFSEGLAAVRMNGKWGYINAAGRVVMPLEYDLAEDFTGGVAGVEQSGVDMYITDKGQVIWPKK